MRGAHCASRVLILPFTRPPPVSSLSRSDTRVSESDTLAILVGGSTFLRSIFKPVGAESHVLRVGIQTFPPPHLRNSYVLASTPTLGVNSIGQTKGTGSAGGGEDTRAAEKSRRATAAGRRHLISIISAPAYDRPLLTAPIAWHGRPITSRQRGQRRHERPMGGVLDHRRSSRSCSDGLCARKRGV